MVYRTQHVFTRDATPRHRLVATVYCELYVRPIYADRLDGSTAPQISVYISCHQQPQQRTRASQQVTLSPYRYIGNQMHTCRPRQSSACHAAAPSAAYRTIAYRILFQQTLRPYCTMYDTWYTVCDVHRSRVLGSGLVGFGVYTIRNSFFLDGLRP